MGDLSKGLAGWALAAGVLALGTPPVAAQTPDPARDLASDLAFDEVGPAPSASAPSAEAGEPASEVVDRFARWVIASGDHGGQAFAVIDKIRARVFVFAADGRPAGSAPILIGSAPGDDTAPGIGELALASIPPDQRTTPAGRFEATFGPAEGAFAEVLWIDLDAAVSLHPVITTNPRQRRLERLASATPLDNRITFGCINVPTAFYDEVLRPAFAGARAVVYVLPDTRELEEVFPGFQWDPGSGSVTAEADAPPRTRRGRADKPAPPSTPRRPRDEVL